MSVLRVIHTGLCGVRQRTQKRRLRAQMHARFGGGGGGYLCWAQSLVRRLRDRAFFSSSLTTDTQCRTRGSERRRGRRATGTMDRTGAPPCPRAGGRAQAARPARTADGV